MTGIRSIADDVKWRIAAEFISQLPVLYEKAFRPNTGNAFDEMEQKVWLASSKIISDIARSLSLPVRTASQVADTMDTIMKVLFGPDFKSETLEVSSNGAVIIVRRCPILAQASGSGLTGEQAFGRCMAFTLGGVPVLNKEFSARFVRTMCTGDRQCEIKIQSAEAPASAGAANPPRGI